MSTATTATTALVFVAMEEEAAPYLAHATSVGAPVAIGRSVQRDLTVPGGGALTLVLTGIGLVNAAAAATAAIVSAHARGATVRGAVSAGSAGALSQELRVGDVVVGAECANLDADARAFGYALGQTPGMPARYAGDPALLAAALDQHEADWAVHSGLVASSDRFMTAETLGTVAVDFPGLAAVDMETLALAQTCFAFDVPFLAVRGISDFADEDAAAHNDANATSSSARSLTVTLRALGL
ncbi:adenosylhomocysteine nucleosidase [Frondihabitans sp. PhB188]|uniref:5'-methylthioadenosine/S-adenosylhomocysteine nucleosidase n=1 Tax=Frondihabitans sp. PhB188 TaxID=2485200 RepID=UPI000F4827EC|nr:5'-methylthioadenosine/S-adenosylhomocysteine nucleosidase [Frondihabitans sp. PhB188]ROQ41484.1 adenosylhomocysteine nucleosidase [Frondihabitans sp. PhB188]